jgi:hypothetical protein
VVDVWGGGGGVEDDVGRGWAFGFAGVHGGRDGHCQPLGLSSPGGFMADGSLRDGGRFYYGDAGRRRYASGLDAAEKGIGAY